MTKRYEPVEPTLFGKTMKKHRERAGITTKLLAKTCGCATSYLNAIELGRQFGSEDVLRCVRDELHIETWLFDLHFYQWGRISEELQFTDLSWAGARLEEFRNILETFRVRMRS